MTTVRAHGRSCLCLQSQKRALEFLNICNKCFIVAWRNVVVRLQSTLYYSINDQSNWSGPFSLVVMTPDFHLGDRGSRPALAGCLYFSSYYHTDCFKYPSMSQILESRITKFRLFRLFNGYRASMTCE